MLTKEEVSHVIDQLPEEFSIDQLIDKLLFVEMVKKGLQQSRDGETISHEQAKQRLTTIN